MEKVAPEPKKRKLKQPPRRGSASSPAAEKAGDATSARHLTVPVAQSSEINFRIQQAKSSAVAQARQEGSTANFKIFDSPFGNFLVPVIPTRKELGG